MLPWSGKSQGNAALAKPASTAAVRQPIIANLMDAKLSPGTGVVILLGVASAFASNHLCARIAFDHGASVATAVSVRATFTALHLFFVMRAQGVAIAIPRALRGHA